MKRAKKRTGTGAPTRTIEPDPWSAPWPEDREPTPEERREYAELMVDIVHRFVDFKGTNRTPRGREARRALWVVNTMVFGRPEFAAWFRAERAEWAERQRLQKERKRSSPGTARKKPRQQLLFFGPTNIKRTH